MKYEVVTHLAMQEDGPAYCGRQDLEHLDGRTDLVAASLFMTTCPRCLRKAEKKLKELHKKSSK
jgi:hypothetical protein